MATVCNRAHLIERAAEAWAKASGHPPLTINLAYCEATLAPDGNAMVTLKNNNGTYVAHVYLAPDETAKLGKQVTL